MFKAICLGTILSLTLVKGEPPTAQYGVPFNNGGNVPISSYGTPNYNANDDQHNHDHSQPMAYEFGYQVKDDYSGNNYGRQEKSDGNQVTGEYRVHLPDGRVQIVTYYADWQTGYHADVRYEGEAQYPDQYNTNNQYPGTSNQYGPPDYSRNQGGNQYNDNSVYNYNNPAKSSVTIKDLSGASTPYHGNNYNGGYNYDSNTINDGLSFDGGYNNFGSKTRPSNAYGAP